MRWQAPRWNETRIIKKFLLFPTKIDGEVRWLEWAYIKQVWKEYWINSKFTEGIDEPELKRIGQRLQELIDQGYPGFITTEDLEK